MAAYNEKLTEDFFTTLVDFVETINLEALWLPLDYLDFYERRKSNDN